MKTGNQEIPKTKETDLSLALVDASGGTRHRATPQTPEAQKVTPTEGSKPALKRVSLSIECPPPVRNQVKALAAEQGMTLQQLIFESFNDLFAKYGKPEIAPTEQKT